MSLINFNYELSLLYSVIIHKPFSAAINKALKSGSVECSLQVALLPRQIEHVFGSGGGFKKWSGFD